MKQVIKFVLVIFGISVCMAVVVMGMLVLSFFVPLNGVNVDPLPPYTNGTLIDFKSFKQIPKELQDRAQCSITNIESYSVFLTKDEFSQVRNYYSDLAAKLSKQGVEIVSSNEDIQYVKYKNTVCYSGKNNTDTIPQAGVGMLDPNNPQDAKTIAQYFPNAVGETVVITTYGHYSLDYDD